MIEDKKKKNNKYFIHREFLNLFRAGREGQGKEMSAEKIRQPKRGRGGRGVGGIPPRPSGNISTPPPARLEQNAESKISFFL
ncbi:MAG: hypothetical protein HZC03_01740 [Candidatus Lloydbacteria bacterium]|nr:hypothetical protein [Candidatus Lloydbacteria bacterium]